MENPSKSSVNWIAISERVPEAEKAAYLAFKAKSDGYLRKYMQEIEEFKKVAASNIKVAELRIEEIKNLLPYSQMTYEDAAYIEPDLTLDLENKPHQEIDYVFDEPQEEGSGKQKKAEAGH
ncbi:ATP synthase subunit d, mitochondrial-like [Daktulosphaira vitifoliae]|uniref:ATP synthase subunit d, mitochondrial-like n=1 Tax=Daktulosphaira vitifoliae TaxID=58002 RepID=UPI0021AADA22|nr:ATP synthase subunit d, mitochondrial-like [Daktulosphaira vitifoliae]